MWARRSLDSVSSRGGTPDCTGGRCRHGSRTRLPCRRGAHRTRTARGPAAGRGRARRAQEPRLRFALGTSDEGKAATTLHIVSVFSIMSCEVGHPGGALGGGLERQSDSCPFAGVALERNDAAPTLDEAARDRQPEPGPARRRREGGLEYPRQRLGGDPAAVVDDDEPAPPRRRPAPLDGVEEVGSNTRGSASAEIPRPSSTTMSCRPPAAICTVTRLASAFRAFSSKFTSTDRKSTRLNS